MTATLQGVSAKKKREPAGTAEAEAARELVRRAREQGLSLTGPDGLLKQLHKTVLETALSEEMTEHLGHDKGGRVVSESGNIRNGSRPKTVLTENTGQVEIEVPRDRAGTFEPQIAEVAAAPVESRRTSPRSTARRSAGRRSAGSPTRWSRR
jgi:hypothetical protein